MEQPRYSSAHEKISKLYIHTMEHNSAIKKNKLLIYAIKLMTIPGIFLSVKSLTAHKNYKLCNSSFMKSWKKQYHRKGEQISYCQHCRWERGDCREFLECIHMVMIVTRLYAFVLSLIIMHHKEWILMHVHLKRNSSSPFLWCPIL